MKTVYIKKSTIKLFFIILAIFVFDITLVHINSDSFSPSPKEQELIEKYNNKKLLILTFDDGPSKHTSDLLNILREENVKANFFILGENAIKYPEILQQEKNEGHVIGIHSYKHLFFTKISREEVLDQITTTSNIIYEITQEIPSYIRVPYGILNDDVKDIIESQELQSVLWNVDSLDWDYKNTEKIVSHVIDTTTGNDIILMHDTFDTTVSAVQRLIKYYKEKGFEFVTLNEFERIKNMSKSLK